MKTIRKLLIPINIILSLIVVACLVCAMIFSEARLALLIITLLSFLVFIAFDGFYLYAVRQEREEEADYIIDGIDKYRHNQRVIVKELNDPDLEKVANEVSNLSILGRSLRNKYVYHMKDFLSYVDNHLDYNDLTNLAYIYMKKEVPVKDILDKYDIVYMNKEEVGFSIMVANYADKKALENIVRMYANKNNHVSIIYYPDYSLLDFIWLDRLKPTFDSEFLKIYDQEENRYKLNNYYSVINEVTFKEDKSDIDVEDFILKSMRFLPFSNVSIEINGQKDYFKWSDKDDFLDHNKEEYEYFKEVNLYRKDGNILSVTLAAYRDLRNLSNDQQLILDSFLNTLLVIYLPKFLHILDKETEKRIQRNMRNNRGYNYVIDKDHNIIAASENLQEKFKDELVGKKCYHALFNRKAPCDYCPRMGKEVSKSISKMGTNNYIFSGVDMGKETQISFVEENHKILNRQALQEILLDQINSEKRGYVMVFKIDYLTDLSLKYNIDKEKIVNDFVDVLKAYSLDGSLYRKEEDEFAYVLQNARYADCVDIAKRLSFAFEDKISIGDNGVLLTPKIILLSYPLEINSLFALDSLSRTLFKKADKRGKLYRLAIDPVYVNRKREYLEIIEQSLKDNKIPVLYKEIVDKENKDHLKDVRYNYIDKDNNEIREDTLTLYAKLEGFYFPILERVFKSVEFLPGHQYVFYFGKEAIDNSLFATVVNELNAMKIPLKNVIIISEESYLEPHKDLVKKYGDMGLQFALSNVEGNITFDLPAKIKYVRINPAKFKNNKPYALKILELSKLGIPFICNQEVEGLTIRYIEKY